MKRVLVTGAFGFLGSHVVKYYKAQGFFVAGVGSSFEKSNSTTEILDKFLISEITIEALMQLDEDYDVIIHCAGGSSVGKSMENPNKDLLRTTLSSEIVLEFIRLYSPNTKLIYTSSAAVYGDLYASKISEDANTNPMSFYGVHKKLSEELCEFYHNRFDIDVAIIRFFSIYGPGLQKQLLWDACNKISSNLESLVFFGTGDELRDWIEITDALNFIDIALQGKESFFIVNAGTGHEVSVQDMLVTLKSYFDSKQSIIFNKEVKVGDPKYLCANIAKAQSLGWKQRISIEEGLKNYVTWYKEIAKTY